MALTSSSDYLTVETLWVPLSDGRKLASRLFLPADGKPAPLILEYIPYRRRDGTRPRDDMMHGWFAANGFACARLDISGTGDSDGLVDDEYVAREQDDVVEAIEFLGTQSWCSGTVGMIGISWGGFSGLQAAYRRPPRLKAIVTACSTDDRFACDAHYSGGCLINDNFAWGGAFFSYGALPPDPQVVGADRWRDMWRERIDAVTVFPAGWLRHQRKDAYWKQGSVSEDWSRIDCAVLAVGGWLDGYTQTIFRLVENMPGRAWGLCGPWGHQWPQNGVPGPAIGFLQECKRFYDRWLRDEPNGAENDPAMRLFVMDPCPPATFHAERPGRWVGLPDWPPAPDVLRHQALHLAAGTLQAEPLAAAPVLTISSSLTTGIAAQEWCPYGIGIVAAESSTDQRADDAMSLCFDTRPLESDWSILGEAVLTLRVASDRPQAQIVVRVNSVAPDGVSAMVTFALLNLSHRGGSEHPEPMEPGQFETVTVRLKPVGQVIPAGHRVRLALSTSYWPMAWPGPEKVTLSVDPAGSRLDLPLLGDESGLPGVTFQPAESAPIGAMTEVRPAVQHRRFINDMPAQTTMMTSFQDDGVYVINDIATEVSGWRRKDYTIGWNDPLSCTTTIICREERTRPDWQPRLDTELTCTADADAFRVHATLRAWDGDTLFAERQFDETIPRDCM